MCVNHVLFLPVKKDIYIYIIVIPRLQGILLVYIYKAQGLQVHISAKFQAAVV